MIRRVAKQRRFGRWLVGLYVLAMLGCFLPLVASYSGHSGASAVAEVTRGAGAHERHHLGDADDAAHHHVLQDLIGAIAGSPGGDHAPVVPVAMSLAVPPSLIAAHGVRLDRPPKTFLSI